MSKIITFIPEPKEEYSVENQRLINLALFQIIEKLNFSYKQEIQNEQNTFNWFISWLYNTKTQVLIYLLLILLLKLVNCRPTDRQTDIATYRAAIAAKNTLYGHD